MRISFCLIMISAADELLYSEEKQVGTRKTIFDRNNRKCVNIQCNTFLPFKQGEIIAV